MENITMKLIRLTSGEEIICNLDMNKAGGTYTISDGFVVVPTGEGKVGFVEFMQFSDGSPITIANKFVMFVTPPNKGMEETVQQMLKQIKDAGNVIIAPEGARAGGIIV
jgi:lysophospholipid acyltransferase (LPLAT)-like uncharacterized protein